MPDFPHLSESEIEAHFYEPYFRRGKNYFLNGNIIDPIRRGNAIEGRSLGSLPNPYKVRATLGPDGIKDTDCSCPIGGGCKHAAALLLAWANDPGQFTEREFVDNNLESRSRFELIAIINEMIKRQPDLEDVLDLPVPGVHSKEVAVDPEVYHRQIRNAFLGAHDWGPHFGVPIAISSVTDMAEKFAEAEDWYNAKIIYQVVVEEVCVNYENAFHDEGQIIGEINRAAEGLTDCFLALTGDSIACQGMLRSFFELFRWDIKMGGYGAGDGIFSLIIDKLDREERAVFRSWITAEAGKKSSADKYSTGWRRNAWAKLLLELDERDNDIEGFLQRAEAMGMHRSLFRKLVDLQRVEEAVEVASEFLRESEYSFLEAALNLENAGYDAHAFQMVNKEIENIKDNRLLAWLAQKFEESGDLQGSLDLQLRRWQDRPNLDDYIQIKKLGITLGGWADLRPQILSDLNSPQWKDVLARIHLHEQDWDAAWAVVDSFKMGFWGGNPGEFVAQATEKHRPKKAMQFYLSRAEQLIDRRGRQNYAAACEYMNRVRKIAEETEQYSKWADEIQRIRDNNRNLPALQDEMNKAGL